MTIGELKKAIKDLPDNVIIEASTGGHDPIWYEINEVEEGDYIYDVSDDTKHVLIYLGDVVME